jgi:hypothetical protein
VLPLHHEAMKFLTTKSLKAGGPTVGKALGAVHGGFHGQNLQELFRSASPEAVLVVRRSYLRGGRESHLAVVPTHKACTPWALTATFLVKQRKRETSALATTHFARLAHWSVRLYIHVYACQELAFRCLPQLLLFRPSSCESRCNPTL